jgi:multicomponent Na+:H+ antiporter subunit F
MNLDSFFIAMTVAIMFLMLCNLYRVVAGPTVIDRMLGMNVIGTKTTILIILIGVIDGRVNLFIDITLAYALLSFITSIAAARFYQRIAQRPRFAPKESVVSPSARPRVEEADVTAPKTDSKQEEPS